MREKILKVLAETMELELNIFSDDTVIKDIDGFDSLRFVMVISELQENYSIDIPLDRAIEAETIGELIACAKEIV